jgi:type II secretory pathway predicted ATPase ExeA
MMNTNYRSFFGLKKQPFGADISINDILKTAELSDVKDRFDYVIGLGAIGLVTGEVGSGKSTAIRYAAEHLHPSEFKSLYMTASSGAIMEFYRQLVNELGIHIKTNSKAMMQRQIKQEITALVCEKKIKVVLLVDEASLLRLEVFAELHTICLPAHHLGRPKQPHRQPVLPFLSTAGFPDCGSQSPAGHRSCRNGRLSQTSLVNRRGETKSF